MSDCLKQEKVVHILKQTARRYDVILATATAYPSYPGGGVVSLSQIAGPEREVDVCCWRMLDELEDLDAQDIYARSPFGLLVSARISAGAASHTT